MGISLKSSSDGTQGTIEVAGVERPKFFSTGAIRPAYTNTTTINGTATFFFNPVIRGQVCVITCTGSGTVTFSAPANIIEGVEYKLMIKAGDTNSRTFTWNSAYKFPGGNSVLSSGSTNNGAYDIITFIGGPSNTLIFDGKQSDVR